MKAFTSKITWQGVLVGAGGLILLGVILRKGK
jgi:hypothetical protein